MNTQAKIILNENAIADSLSHLSKPLVFTNGCFDILHRGHTTYLEQARNLGNSLVVGVNSDESVKLQNKGDNRPINPLEDRMAVLASLDCVDMVVSFNEDTPLRLINIIMPDHLVKGGDWSLENIVGAKEVTDNGGLVHSIAFQFERSTTNLIEKIRSSI